ncbi:uncharacterized protein LOC143919002 [Arctopsyche grandis]|uniref:uncharacterized protein LOC143919002 n=1 Tax=Arctopsyche grandis TaxID=121162 RepID=UPI00406D6343
MSTAAASWWGALALPALAVVAVLAAGLLVVYFGLRPAPEPPAMDPALFDERRSKKKRSPPSKPGSPNSKAKQSNGQVVHEPEVKAKKATPESTKKSPVKSKEEKKPKEKSTEAKKEKNVEKKTPKKEVNKEAPKKQKEVKPVDFDDGEWEKVTSRSDKKSRKNQDDKKESPIKEKNNKNAKVNKEVEEKKKASPKKVEPPPIPKDLQDKVNELQRVLNEVEKRDRSQTPVKLEEKSRESSAPTTPIVKEKKLPEVESPPPPPKAQKAVKKQASNDSDEGVVVDVKTENGAVFDELGDTWTDAKIQKKGKKKPRKDQ